MNLREMMTERIVFSVSEQELRDCYGIDEVGLGELSDLDFLEIYEDVTAAAHY